MNYLIEAMSKLGIWYTPPELLRQVQPEPGWNVVVGNMPFGGGKTMTKPIIAGEIIRVIDAEMLWCEQHPDKAFAAEYRKGFTNGLIQAKYLIGELVRASRNEPAAPLAGRGGGTNDDDCA